MKLAEELAVIREEMAQLREEQRQNMKAMAAMLSEMRSTLGTLKKEMADTAKKTDVASKADKSDLSAAVAEVEKGLKQLEPFIHRELSEVVSGLAGEMGRAQGQLTNEVRNNANAVLQGMQKLVQQLGNDMTAKMAEREKSVRWRIDEFETNMNNKFGY